ncbi:oligopeptide/dipeptide ABC transporter ATP-binding protein [Aliiroseovarius sediminis]|uniref:ABC transporter ATP-binding protein n=1 Tax=Aliiroseovarius sediminis TaxID=2925839 RepID=UPI001F57A9F6|nr:oligopeptide/dipeptide ABC transporter ATP-binding protein [Aliiroseovarius sediminis]MCI2393793.1 ATP-binding cassette domain-containing protein [Aliiroseovarius sediminis]
MTDLLSVRDLVSRFPVGGGLGSLFSAKQYIEAVAGVSFDLEAGQTLALVGESGSGKTTLARAIAGLGEDVSGDVTFDGRDVLNLAGSDRKALRREVAMIFQDAVSSLSPRFTVRALLLEPFQIHDMMPDDPDAEVDRMLSLVGLPVTMADRRPHELSGGQARRVGVARALALKPKLVIADEPTAGLDVSVQGEVLNLLNDLREKLDLALLVITHNLNIVRHVADYMAIMYLGRVVEIGDTQRIFDEPRHPYTAALLSANPTTDADAAEQRIRLEGEVPSLLDRPSGCEFHGRCPFVRDKCREVVPEVSTTQAGRRFTCHFPLGPDGAPTG